jgi:hypothetical protein
MAISTAGQFFDRLITGGSPAIEALVIDAVHETEWLDFKSGEHLSDEKATWSEAVCGFANNQGAYWCGESMLAKTLKRRSTLRVI